LERQEATVADRPGSPQNPLPPGTIDTKFLNSSRAIMGSRAGEALRRLRSGAVTVRELLVV